MHHEDWLSKQEVAALTGWSPRHIERLAADGDLRTRPSNIRSGNGKPVKEYAGSSLPSEFQMKRLHQRMASQALVPIKHSPTAIATLPRPGSETEIRALASLNDEDRQQAQTRLQVLAPMIDFQNLTNGHKPIFTDGGKQITTLGGVAKHIASISGFSERTIWNWWDRYREGGAGALADRRRSDLNTSRFFAAHREAGQFAQSKYLHERLSFKVVHEALLREWPRLSHGQGQPPDYKTLRVYLQNLSPLITAVAREGERKYNEDFAPFLVRNIEAKRVNEYWISDHVIHDVWVRNDGVFGELAENEAFRPWLTCITDMRSRRVVGTAWCVNPSSESISSALRFAMRHYGRPGTLYIDNGKDYLKITGHRLAPGLSEDAKSVLFRLGIKSQHCLPKHPQSKQIESFFRTFHQRFDVLWRSAGVYCGTSPSNRPEECDTSLREHKQLVKLGMPEKSPLPPASEFIQAAINWIEEFNTTFPHSGQGMNGRSPRDIYDSELPPGSRAPVNPLDVAQLFWSRQKRVVGEGGTVQLFNARYEPADQESFAALMLAVKTEVLVAADPLNVGEAIALTLDDKFLGTLRSQELLVHGETSQAQIQSSMRARRRVYTAVKQLIAAQARARTQAGDVTELEALTRRAVKTAEPNIHRALPVLKAVNGAPEPRLHVDDIVDRFEKEN